MGALIMVAATMVLGAPAVEAGAAPSGQGDEATVTITDKLSTQHLSVAPGTTVTWVNKDSEEHRVRSDKDTGIEFDSGGLETGEQFSYTFGRVGNFTYHDHDNDENPAYFGMVMVERGAGGGSGGGGGGAGGGGGGGDSTAPMKASVSIGDDFFRPGDVTISVGGTVTWNNGGSDHTVTATGGEFDSGNLQGGQTFTHTFNKAGTFSYLCDYHDEMQATVRVMDASGDVPPPPDNDNPPPPPDNDNPPPPDNDNPPPPPGDGGGEAPAKASVSIGDDFFRPGDVTISVGGKVTWKNGGSDHTVTATGGEFDSGNLPGGQTFTHTFNKPGTFSYLCDYHDEMQATVRVMDASGDVPPPTDNPPPPDNDNPPPPGGGNNPPPPGGGGGGSQAPAKASVKIGDDFFNPGTVKVRAGGTVVWSNTGSDHTVTAMDGSFDSGNLPSGKTFKHTFKNAGTYKYLCAYHDGMTGTVKVVSASGDVPPGGSGGGGGTGGAGGGKSGGSTGGGTAGGGGAASSPGSQTHTITMTADSFSPSVLSARVGDTVVWKNTSSLPHTVTGGPWDANVMTGQSFTTVLRDQGTISYKCNYHPGMTGTLKVAAAPAGTDLPPASADTGLSGGSAAAASTSSGSTTSSSGGSAGAPAPGAESHTIQMVNSTFDPQSLTARVGDEVTWVNEDPVPHNVTGGPLASDMIMGGESFTTVLTETGTIEYECTLHPGMTGTLTVQPPLPGTEVPAAGSSTTTSSSSADTAQSEESTPSAEPDAGAQNHTVDIVDFVYDPATLEAHVGDTVTFVNKDAAPHTATANDKSFDSGNMNQGDKWTLKLEKVGTIEYLCTYHPNMVGTLIVKPKDAEIAPATAASDSGGADTAAMSASQLAGFSSGWLALLAFLAGMQLQARFASRRTTPTP